MAIVVASGAADTICAYADGFVLHVTGVTNVEAAGEALAAARTDIVALRREGGGTDGPVVSNVVLGPSGPLLRVALLDADEPALRSIPDLVTARLEAAGLDSGTVDAPEPGGDLDGLDLCPSAVLLRLFPEPAGAAGVLRAEWVDIACEWVLGDLAPGNLVPMRLLGAEFDVRVADAPAILHQASVAGAWCDIVNGDLRDRVRTASITFGRAPHVTLAAGGPGCDDSALIARFDLLCEVALELSGEAAYACVDFEPTFEGIGLGLAGGGWRDRGGASPNLVAGELVDVLVPDVFPFQVLGKGHVARLQAAGIDPPLGEPLADGGAAVRIGDPADWLPIHEARDDAQAEGFELLAPVLATEAEAAELLAARPDRTPTDESAPAPPVTTVTPDLDDIVLETMPHARRGLRLTFLELVSWLAHEPHSDAPRTVSPVLATYARWFASSLGSGRRQELKSRARLLIGTAQPPAAPGGLSPADAERVWLATDWLIRVQAAAWLRLAGLEESAARLETLPPTTDHLELVRAVDVLGSAITIASRRIELTASIAGTDHPEDAELVEQAAWEAWEEAAETSGWVAASEAAGVGIPGDLAYATDLRVIEIARDPRVRDELQAARRSVGDAAWATALHAVADDAWTAGWSAAQAAIDRMAVVPLRTALDRGTRAAATRMGLDDDVREDALDAAEVAAKERLTRAALGALAWGSQEHPWDAARTAAAGEPTGVWAAVQDLARAAVDEAPWEAGMAAARSAVDDVLNDAPSLVARTVGAAAAREAAGTAARGVAMRAAAVARAHGGDVAEISAAAAGVLAGTAEALQDSAFALLDELISTGAAR